jgi:hypothetical protein
VPNPLADRGTIALWYFVRDYYNYQTIWDNSIFENDWELWVYETGIVRGRVAQASASGQVSFDLNSLDGPNHWYHIAFTWDRDDLSAEAVKLYVNGELASAAAITTWTDPGDFFYLGGGNDGNAYGNGIWDDFRIYDKPLTQGEVLFIMEGTTSCPEEGDTHAEELVVEGPAEGDVPGSYEAIAFASDDSGDKIFYTFTADDGVSAPQIAGPQFSNLATFELTEGTWTITVVVDDQPECDDQAADAVRTVEVTVTSGPTEGVFHRGDANGDGDINITDGIFVLNYLFLGGPTPDCLEAANPNDDAEINITDGIFVLNYLFLGGPEPAPPGPTTSPCGEDPADSPSDLGCSSYTEC